MHELLLHASVPTARHAQILSILAGIAAMQPQPFHERHRIYKPTRPATKPAAHVGGSQAVQQQGNPMQAAVQGAMQGDLFYLHLVEDLVGEGKRVGEVDGGAEEGSKPHPDVVMDGGYEGGGGEETNGVIEKPSPSPFPPSPLQTLQFRDIPLPGSRLPCTSRLIADIPITSTSTTASSFLSALSYTQTSTHHLKGHRLTHNSTTSILLFQPCLPAAGDSQGSSSGTKDQENEDRLHPLSPQSHILQLSVRVADGTKPDLVARGVEALMALKETLRGVVELEAVERGLLDTRVR